MNRKIFIFCTLATFLIPILISCKQDTNPFAKTSIDFNTWGPRLVDDNIMPDADDIGRFKAQVDSLFTGNQESVPFSFEYGGVSSRKFLDSWQFDKKERNPLNTVYSWTDPASGLKVGVEVRWFEKFAAADWVFDFTNTGARNTAKIENVKTLDLTVGMRNDRNLPNIINTLNGDNNSANSFLPVKYPLKEGENKRFVPVGGRSSNGAFPFWNIQKSEASDNEQSEGMFVTIGWSGQWATDFTKVNDKDLHISAGMEKISTILYPGESIRQPRILLMPWHSSRTNAQVLFRRLLMFEYTPKTESKLPVQMPMAGQCFDGMFTVWKNPYFFTYDGQIEWGKKLHEAGFNTQWVDAGWFPGGFPDGVGNWYSDTELFPEGLEALGKAIHDLDMKFVLWFEIERVAKDTQIANEHPEYVFNEQSYKDTWNDIFAGGLFKLYDPKARKYLTELLHDRINRYGIDVLRIDLNINPLPFWIANDTKDRQGMTEIRYVEGHYEMWKQLIEENPGLLIDNCASGGRRIDIETTAISVPLWRSDISCRPGRPEWHQTQTLGLTQYLPLFSCASWESDPYNFRSSANMGAIASFNFMGNDYDRERAKASCEEAKVYQKFWYGDFYPLSEASLGKTNLFAWQLHREDLNAGIVYIFRQIDCQYTGFEPVPHAIDRDATYEITVKRDYSGGITKTLSGRQFIEMCIEMPERQSSAVIEYRKIKK